MYTDLGNDGYLVRYNTWSAGADFQYDFTEKVYGTVAFKWNRTQYTGNWEGIYSSYDVFSVPVSLLYRVTQKVAVGLTYQYRYSDYFDGSPAQQALGSSREDHFIGLTVNGEIAPKMTCEFYLGAQNYSIDNAIDGNDSWTMATNLKLGYEVSEKMGVYVKVSRDYGNTASRYTTTNTWAEGGVNYYFNPKIIGTASLRYKESKYDSYNRTDETIWTRVGVSYLPNKFVTLGINYNYLNNDSDVSTANYNQHIVSFNATLRY